MTNLSRRKFVGLTVGLFAAAPAIVRASSLMPIRAWTDTTNLDLWDVVALQYQASTTVGVWLRSVAFKDGYREIIDRPITDAHVGDRLRRITLCTDENY